MELYTFSDLLARVAGGGSISGSVDRWERVRTVYENGSDCNTNDPIVLTVNLFTFPHCGSRDLLFGGADGYGDVA